MKTKLFLTLLLFVASLLSLTETGYAQSQTPQLTSFRTSSTSVSSLALRQRTARIPVSWTSVNRPIFANLVFEQILDDGVIRNAELPRTNPIVPSEGVGIVSLILPNVNAEEVHFRVRLIDLASGEDLDSREIQLPIEGASGMNNNSFTVSAEMAQPGETIILRWAIAESFSDAQLVLSVSGEQTEQVLMDIQNAEGQLSYPIPEDASSVQDFTLRIRTQNGRVQEMSHSVSIGCDVGFLFPDFSSCPPGPIESSEAVYQAFEQGFMVWRQDVSPARIMVMYIDGTAELFVDDWNGESIEHDLIVPEGRLIPERGFGHVWHNTARVKSSLGWALGPEISYTAQSQARDATQIIGDISLEDGRILRLDGNRWVVR